MPIFCFPNGSVDVLGLKSILMITDSIGNYLHGLGLGMHVPFPRLGHRLGFGKCFHSHAVGVFCSVGFG